MDIFLMIKKAFHIYSSKMYTPLNKIKFRLNRVQYGKKFRSMGMIYICRHFEGA